VYDYFRMSWLYLLKERTQVPIVIKYFLNEIKIQFSTTIHVLHTDNTLEYTKKKVSHFYASHGILHHTTYLHTSHQNGVLKEN